jgi:hypothetical protein
MGGTEFSGKDVLLSSGLSNQADDCSSGTSTTLQSQITTLNGFGAKHIVVVGTYRGTTRGENPVDLEAVDKCVKQAVQDAGVTTAYYLDGFTDSADHYKPSDPQAYLISAEKLLGSNGGSANASGNVATKKCDDGTLPPCD